MQSVSASTYTSLLRGIHTSRRGVQEVDKVLGALEGSFAGHAAERALSLVLEARCPSPSG